MSPSSTTFPNFSKITAWPLVILINSASVVRCGWVRSECLSSYKGTLWVSPSATGTSFPCQLLSFIQFQCQHFVIVESERSFRHYVIHSCLHRLKSKCIRHSFPGMLWNLSKFPSPPKVHDGMRR